MLQEPLISIIELNELGALPSFVVLNNIIGGGGDGANSILRLMQTNHAVWHKNCRSAVNKQKVDWAKSKLGRSTHQESPMKTRWMDTGKVCEPQDPGTSPESSDSSVVKRFFCESGDKKEMKKA